MSLVWVMLEGSLLAVVLVLICGLLLSGVKFLRGLFIVLLLSTTVSAQFLIDRDSESWGYPAGGVKLTERLVTQAGRIQRFNPAVMAERIALTNVKLYIDLPDGMVLEPNTAWRRTAGRTYVVDLGTINPGTYMSTYEALYFSSAVPRKLRISYLISAQELRRPKSGVIVVEVQ